ncbi:MAG TPA: hypothetical protein VIU44_08080 [Gaiellaceae bacterium]
MAVIRGGDKLEAYLAGIAARASKPGTLKVGFLAGAAYPDGTPVALVAAVQNFGAPSRGIPPRPFFSDMVAAKKEQWGPTLGAALQHADFDGPKALQVMGDQIAGDLRQSIKDTDSPPLKPATIRRKGFDKPLVDSGHMLNSVDYEVT